MRYLIRSVPYLLVAALLSGQTIRVNVGLVQTDVMVFDADGRFVDDVTREQFELRVDGVPQPFEFFELIRTGSPEDERHWPLRAATPEAAKLPDRGQSLFFFVDDLHLSTGSVQRVRESLSSGSRESDCSRDGATFDRYRGHRPETAFVWGSDVA
jgi:hypothetical protein